MARCIALLDANVLYPAPLRDILMQMALKGLFQAKWTAQIHSEWIEALLRNEPQRKREDLERTRDLMDTHILDAYITDYEVHIPSLYWRDENDRHVLAAAIHGECSVIVTKNLRDFPSAVTDSYSIQVQHPDAFLHSFLIDNSEMFCETLHAVRSRLKHPPYSVETYLSLLQRQGLTQLTESLQQYSACL